MHILTLTSAHHYSGVMVMAAAFNYYPQSASLTSGLPPTLLQAQWHGIIGIEGEPTPDGRVVDRNALKWNLPLPLLHAAHEVGTVTAITRRDSDGALMAEGTYNLDTPEGVNAARGISSRELNGTQMGLDNAAYEVRVTEGMDDPASIEASALTIERVSGEKLEAVTSARLRSVSLVETPAFAWARLHPTPTSNPESLAASVAVLNPAHSSAPSDTLSQPPPYEWFTDPHLSEPTALQVTDDGRVMAHLAAWGTPHVGITNEYVTPPKSPRQGPDAYRYFNLGGAPTSEGWIAAGNITLGTLHAEGGLGSSAARYHYENTGSAVADVVAGEDAHGIWIAGAVRPGVHPDKLRELRASPLSGDWRRIGGHLELVAALSVNRPGFPIPRPAGLIKAGNAHSLMSAGTLMPYINQDDDAQIRARAWRLKFNRAKGGVR